MRDRPDPAHETQRLPIPPFKAKTVLQTIDTPPERAWQPATV